LVKYQPGPIVLFGSGETSASGRKIFDAVMRRLPYAPRLALLETPAGFELNSAQVIGRVGEFICRRLQNYAPQVFIVPARMRGTPYSPDDPVIASPLLTADLIFMGPGSPTYTVRQLQNSVAWHYLIARHRLGCALALASAAIIAVSSFALPVYEIYKVGEDLSWKKGLDFFGLFDLSLVFIPHWNNQDGSGELDTSRCFMGQTRFVRLMEMLPPESTVVGLDEKTGLIIDLQSGTCQVIGLGGVILIHMGPGYQYRDAFSKNDLRVSGLEEIVHQRQGHVHRFLNGQTFELKRIGSFRLPEPTAGIPQDVWDLAVKQQQAFEEHESVVEQPPIEVVTLIREREANRQKNDWAAADRLRSQIAERGWLITDTPQGPELNKKPCGN
jgi:cyanophycinase-like exopeptidase